MASECKGCRNYSGLYCQVGIIPRIENTVICPCRTCLVKTMCTNKCEEYAKYKVRSRLIKGISAVNRDFQKGEIFHYS
jgi:hypothetical protein